MAGNVEGQMMAADGDGIGIDQLAFREDRDGGGGAAQIDAADPEMRFVIDQCREA